MAKLNVFNFITLNGYYKDAQGTTSWHQHGGQEEGEYAASSMKSGGILVFGRVTYEMMSSFWPTPQALESMPDVAKGMNSSEKLVFSKTLKKADWNNTTLVNDDLIKEIKKRKAEGKDMTILGSGSIITQCAEAGLIDSYELMLDPIALGNGTPMFKGMKRQLDLKLVATRTFKSGIVLLSYKA